jgi:hypothetical protein
VVLVCLSLVCLSLVRFAFVRLVCLFLEWEHAERRLT